MDLQLLNKAIALCEQECQQDPICVVTNKPHDFNFYFNDGERVCWDCDLIKPGPKIGITPDYRSYSTKNKYDHKVYLKQLIQHHEEQNNCSIPYEVYDAFKRFLISFLLTFPNKPKISTRYVLYRLAQRYSHSCPDSSFVKIKHQKTKDRYESICNQIFGNY